MRWLPLIAVCLGGLVSCERRATYETAVIEAVLALSGTRSAVVFNRTYPPRGPTAWVVLTSSGELDYLSAAQESVSDFRAVVRQPPIPIDANALSANHALLLVDPPGNSSDFERALENSVAVGGAIRLSRVGFNRKRDEAIVYAEYYCGPKCAEGWFLLLKRRDGTWTIKDRVRAFVM